MKSIDLINIKKSIDWESSQSHLLKSYNRVCHSTTKKYDLKTVIILQSRNHQTCLFMCPWREADLELQIKVENFFSNSTSLELVL